MKALINLCAITGVIGGCAASVPVGNERLVASPSTTVWAKGLPPYGKSSWTVHACPEHERRCFVPVWVRKPSDPLKPNECTLIYPDIVELASGQTKVITWALVSHLPDFNFGHPQADAGKQAGIQVVNTLIGGDYSDSADFIDDFSEPALPTNLYASKRLRQSPPLPRHIYFYNIRVQWRADPQSAHLDCEEKGPMIVNRGG